MVTCDVGDTRPDLFVTCQQEEGRCAARLHDVEARLGLRQLTGAMRPHGSTAVHVGVDQWRQRRRAFEGGIEAEAQFAPEREIWPEPCRHHELIDNDVAAAARRSGADPETAIGFRDVRDLEPGFQCEPALLDQAGEGGAQLAPAARLSLDPPPKAFSSCCRAEARSVAFPERFRQGERDQSAYQ